jgi:transcription-repair coupling factor (superfamily II helicase)
VDSVGGVGQWAARGGIVDIFSPAQPTPARVEFFGDEIESIRLFDPTSQRSTGALDELVVLPVEPSTPRDARLLTYLGATAPVIVDAPACWRSRSPRADRCWPR